MGYTDDDIKRLAMLREWLEKQIVDKEEELERLRSMLAVVDNMLKQVSFRPAVTLPKSTIEEGISREREGKEVEQIKEKIEYKEVRAMKSKDNITLANAYISTNHLSIVPLSDVRLYSTIPPFQSFFINRIMKEMKNKDEERVKSGEIAPDQVLDYKVEQDESNTIKRIIIYNYRDKERLNEIINAATWVFTRMLEKVR
jgi:hypothetical protein